MDYNYLNKLIEEVNSFRKQIAFLDSSTAECMVSYMATKKTSFIGYKQGYNDVLNREQKGMKESDNVRTTVKDYLKYFKIRMVILYKLNPTKAADLTFYFRCIG